MTDTPAPSRSLPFILHRWPTLLGLGVAAFTLLDAEDGRSVGFVVFLAACIYLGAAVLSPWPSWDC